MEIKIRNLKLVGQCESWGGGHVPLLPPSPAPLVTAVTA